MKDDITYIPTAMRNAFQHASAPKLTPLVRAVVRTLRTKTGLIPRRKWWSFQR